ncbi:MAG: hypothetical protein SWZ49_24400 [Cyanobacteriota bacterium]|nr:hypothetical protein [Cyanobacteriota bacterium]
MKKQILSVTIAIPTVIFATSSTLTNTDIKLGLRKIHKVKYHAIKLDNSMDAMVNPDKGGVRPMPPPPPWIPPVEEGLNNKLPPAYIPKPRDYRNYTPVHLPRSAPWVTPEYKNDDKSKKVPNYPIR